MTSEDGASVRELSGAFPASPLLVQSVTKIEGLHGENRLCFLSSSIERSHKKSS